MRLGVLLGVVLVLCSSASARAAESEASRDSAKALVNQGAKLFGEGHYAEALARFQAAYQVLPNPKILFNIGEADEKLGDLAGAANAFWSFIDQTIDTSDLAVRRSTAQASLAKLTNRVARVQVDTAPGALVSLDGVRMTREWSFVAAGKHSARAEAPDRLPAELQFEVHAEENRHVTLNLEKLTAAVPAAAPTVAAAPAPSATTPPVVIAAEPAPSGGHHTGAWVALGAGGASAAGSALFGVLALSNASKLDDLVGGHPAPGVAPGDASGLRSSVRTDSVVSTALLGTTLVAAGIGAYLMFSDDPAPEPRGANP